MISSDYQFAKVLQEQFQHEIETEKSGDNLAYKKGNKHNLNSSKCLVDPSWEVIDPTPDIHILFMAFNERFFWNKLLAVCVSWSKRMTTCAGICSYQGRGGMCTITLSEPLLKLRPRRDLVETLLHEMIHAYLFVTHNNKDRDGHGPEFHKHMYRINAEAGTNITVYHDFHDEVRLYKQHWWKCNGPCQNRKPYYGLVKRAMNRAPGPNDIWWGEHARTCGGEFTKIKEPDKPAKVKKSDSSDKDKPETVTKAMPDIRNHLVPTVRNNPSATSSSKASITTINDITSPDAKKSPVKSNKVVVGFPNTPGRTLSDSSIPNKDYSLVRNHWLNKFSNSISNDGNKIQKPSIISFNAVADSSKSPPRTSNRPLSSSTPSSSDVQPNKCNGLKRSFSETPIVTLAKVPKLSVDLTVIQPNLVECPVCSKKCPNDELNDHLDQCLSKTKPCIICDKNIPETDYEEHVSKCCDKGFEDDVFVDSNEKKTDVVEEVIISPVKKSVVSFEQCGVCDKPIESSLYNNHLSDCVQKMYQNLEDTYIKKPNCPVCDKEVPESDLSEHLENCRDLSDIFDDDGSLPVEDGGENKGNNCPICSKRIQIQHMNSHIDICLNTSGK